MKREIPGKAATSRGSGTEALQACWRALNDRYFAGRLPSIEIAWSTRLTSSAGMFVSREGPRPRTPRSAAAHAACRLIRLSAPLLQRSTGEFPAALQSTLAHEMIHQWQFDILRRRPNHGIDFHRKMAELNSDGMGITIRHHLHQAVRALARHVWRCRRCGHFYERHRRTIRPERHRCGTCHGPLQEVRVGPSLPEARGPQHLARPGLHDGLTILNRDAMLIPAMQLTLPFDLDVTEFPRRSIDVHMSEGGFP